MSRGERIVTLLAVVLPFIGTALAVLTLWKQVVGPLDLALLVGIYVPVGLGVTVGYHRLLTHRAFETTPAVRYGLTVLASMAAQGSVIDWVADHRKHHAFTDEDGDPHSPHGHGRGIRGALTGLWHAHIGWLLRDSGRDRRRFAPDLLEDPWMRRIDRAFPALTALGLALPFGVGWALTGALGGALTALLWGGLVRVFFLHHVTWSINSVCHFFGRRRFATDDESTNVFWLSLLSFGESWHHNHHAFPRSAKHGLRAWEIDLSGYFIAALERLGLAWNVTRISGERQQARLATGQG